MFIKMTETLGTVHTHTHTRSLIKHVNITSNKGLNINEHAFCQDACYVDV